MDAIGFGVINFIVMLTILFIGLKLSGVKEEWSWLLVFWPIWVPIAAVFVLGSIGLSML